MVKKFKDFNTINEGKKTIYKNTVTIDILSDEPLSDDEINLEHIKHQITEGDWSGDLKWGTKNLGIVGQRAASEIMLQGSDPEFFGMDEEGNEIEY